jgi:cytochrome c oxidase assembly factor 6
VTYFKKWRIADIQKKAKIAALEAEGANKLDAKPDLTAVPAKR